MAFASFGIITPVLSVVLSVFMLGLAVGSWAGGRWIPTTFQWRVTSVSCRNWINGGDALPLVEPQAFHQNITQVPLMDLSEAIEGTAIPKQHWYTPQNLSGWWSDIF